MTALEFIKIHTLNARDSVLLEVATDYFDLSHGQVFDTIQQSLRDLTSGLSAKGIAYSDLAAALVPRTDRSECLYLFDWAKAQPGAYHAEALHVLLPSLQPKSPLSVSYGDWIAKGRFSEWVDASPSLRLRDPLKQAGLDGRTLFLMHLNNLTQTAAKRIDGALKACGMYLGAIDLTGPSALKNAIAHQIGSKFIRYSGCVITPHDYDVPMSENSNILAVDFERHHLAVRSFPGWLYDMFLSFKIESIPLPGERDREFSLNAISGAPIDLAECEVNLADSKLRYLLSAKGGSLKRAGLHALSATEIADRIREKVRLNYIYNLARSVDGSVLKFNVVLDLVPGVRSLCALRYQPTERKLSVITLF